MQKSHICDKWGRPRPRAFSATYTILSFTGNNDKLVGLLIDHPQLSVNLRGLDGYTALIRSASDRADYVAMLLSHPDIDPNLATYFGTTALTSAIRSSFNPRVTWSEFPSRTLCLALETVKRDRSKSLLVVYFAIIRPASAILCRQKMAILNFNGFRSLLTVSIQHQIIPNSTTESSGFKWLCNSLRVRTEPIFSRLGRATKRPWGFCWIGPILMSTSKVGTEKTL